MYIAFPNRNAKQKIALPEICSINLVREISWHIDSLGLWTGLGWTGAALVVVRTASGRAIIAFARAQMANPIQ